jgi:hypothetical protein
MVLAMIVEGILCLPKPAGEERSPFVGLRPVEAAA